MRRLVLLALLPALGFAADHWVRFLSGPYEVYTDTGEKPARETLVRFEEFRHALGQIVGLNDLGSPEPIRIFVLKSVNAKTWNTGSPLIHGRDRYAVVLDEKSPLASPDTYRELARLFLRTNTAQMPPAFEHGLVEFFSTLQIDGIRITAGAPPSKPDLDWARVHLLITSPDFYGKLRVLLYNLRQGVEEDAAYRNAFGKGKTEVEAEANRHFAAGGFQTTSLNNRPLSADQFQVREVSDADARLARADLLIAGKSEPEYLQLLRDKTKVAEAEEGMGLLALQAGQKQEAHQHFEAAAAAGTASARCYIELAKLETDNEKARQALLKAAGINPKLDEPFALLAARDTDPRQRTAHWKAAAERNPRNPAYWKSLAESYLAEHNYAEAAKAWRSGEQASLDPAERDRMRQARLAIETQRTEYEAAERRRAADEEARELEKLKAQARAEVHALEEKANKDTPKSSGPVVPWWDGPNPDGKVAGTLKQVDCLGTQARLVVDAEGKLVKLLVIDPAKIVISGGGQQTLACGTQKARKVSVEYFKKTNARLGTTGEVAFITFQ